MTKKDGLTLSRYVGEFIGWIIRCRRTFAALKLAAFAALLAYLSRGISIELYHQQTPNGFIWGIRQGGSIEPVGVVASLIAFLSILIANFIHQKQNKTLKDNRAELFRDASIPEFAKLEILTGISEKNSTFRQFF